MFQELGMFSDSIGMFSSDVNQLPAPSLNLDFTTGVLDSRITYTRAQAVANTVTYTGSNGLIQYATANTARFDYNPITLACNGLLIEESRANSLTYSSDLTNAAWGKVGAVSAAPTVSNITTNSPASASGAVSSITFPAVTSAGAFSFAYQGAGATFLNTAITASVYMRVASGTASIYLNVEDSSAAPSGGNYFTSTALNLTTSWQRFTLTGTRTSVTGNAAFVIGFDNRGSLGQTNANPVTVQIWGAQLEAGAFATSLIQTTTTSITRNADNASMTGTNFSSWFNASQGTLVSIAIPYNVSAIRGGFVVSDGTANNTIETAHGSTPRAFINTGGVTQLSQASGSVVANSIVKSAISYQANNANGACNGVAGTAVLSCSIPTVNKAIIGNVYDGSNALNGTISKIIAYTVRLPDNTLKGLTS